MLKKKSCEAMSMGAIGKKIVSVVAAVVLLLPVAGRSTKAAGEPEISAAAAVVMELESGRILYEKAADASLAMASTTKIMSALLTLEAGNLDDPFTVNAAAIQVEGSSMGLQKGDRVTLRALAYGMLLPSGNDAANAAAVKVAGSMEEFAFLMNKRAEQIGMEHTNFVTPSGLDAQGHYTTARDMALLTRVALQNPDFKAICGLSSAKVKFGNPPEERWLTNHNKLIKSYEGCIGVKTGFTKQAGRCLVSAAERDGMTVICVTLHAPDDWNDHKKLLDYGFSRLSWVELTVDLSAVTVPVAGGKAESVSVVMTGKNTIALATGDEIVSELHLPKFVYAPIAAGDVVGEVRWCLKSAPKSVVRSESLLAGEMVEYNPVKLRTSHQPSFWEWLVERFKSIFS